MGVCTIKNMVYYSYYSIVKQNSKIFVQFYSDYAVYVYMSFRCACMCIYVDIYVYVY